MDAIVWRVEQTAEDRLILYRRSRQRRPESVIFFPINTPGMDRFKLFDLVGYS